MEEPEGFTRNLHDIEVSRKDDGSMIYYVGNSSLVFKAMYQGKAKRLKCYTRPKLNLETIYAQRYYPAEFLCSGAWIDAVLDDWIEGETLTAAIETSCKNRDHTRLSQLAELFDRLALDLISDDQAHGDLKPDNIIVTPSGELQLIDFDAMYHPSMNCSLSPELGTSAFQHPRRTAEDFNSSLDDYPAAIISTALHALAIEPGLLDEFKDRELLFEPRKIVGCTALKRVLELFKNKGMASHYRIAKLLLSPTLQLPELKSLLSYQLHPPALTDEPLESFFVGHLWGYTSARGAHIPAMYDCAFEFSDSLAAVRLENSWFYINTSGAVVIDATQYEAVKPFRDGRGRGIEHGRWYSFDTEGKDKLEINNIKL